MRAPILIIAFNRPKETRQVIEAVLNSGKRNVYVVVDGPRPNRVEDLDKVGQVRNLVLNSSWTGGLTYLFREANLGCRAGVSEAITWFFDQEEEGIILEDDCLPSNSFFQFMDELLEAFRFDEQVGMISGTTFFSDPNARHDYTFTRYPNIWGWATWRRAWNLFDSNLSTWGTPASVEALHSASGDSSQFVRHWKHLIDDVEARKIDTWDYVWSYSFFLARLVSVSPRINLVKNIGFSTDATHTSARPLGRSFHPDATEISFPLTHPPDVTIDHRLDFLTRELAMGVRGKLFRTALRSLWLIRDLASSRH